MTRPLAVIVLAILAVGLATSPALAQAPEPKVRINGFFDLATSWFKNIEDNDVTNSGDHGWYSRERGRLDFTGEVGKTKMVWGVEMDFVNGVTPSLKAGTSAGFDLDTDVAGVIETKWLYLEAPVTGPGSLLPMVPWPTLGRFGGQPARGHDFKGGMHLSGDFPGASFETTWTPEVKSVLTYVQMREAIDRRQQESWAVLLSVPIDPFKGLTIKPTYSYANFNDGSGNARLGVPAVNGFNPNTGALGHLTTERHTIGGDVRWTIGALTLNPTVYFQWGDQELPAGSPKKEADIRAWIVDLLAQYRLGPLLLGARGAYVPGMRAQDAIQNGSTIRFYNPINSGFIYTTPHSEIWNGITDFNSEFLATSVLNMSTSPSYDKYGTIWVAAFADYSLTPKLTLDVLVGGRWTAEKVDTDGVLTADGLTSPTRGDARYLGTEVNGGYTWRFAPNVHFKINYAYLFAGDALDHKRVSTGSVEDADDVWKLSARIRYTF